jgi:solute carrier family 35 protein
MIGYGLIILNNIATTIHFNRIKTVSTNNPGISVETISFFMSSLSIPILLVLVQFEDESAFNLMNRSNDFYFLLGVSCMSGITLTFSQNLCTVVNSPITTSITGNVKDVGLTFVSFLIFTDVVATPWLIVGLVMSLAGAFIYSYPQIQESYKGEKKIS